MTTALSAARRNVFVERHDHLRAQVRSFLTAEVLPDYANWIVAGRPPDWFFRRIGELGVLGIGVPVEHGGTADWDFRDSVVVTEEIQRLGLAIGGLRVHTDICIPYLLRFGSEVQLGEWLPKMVNGDVVAALALSEPGAGSDLKSMRTSAIRDGDHYIVNGSKTFISNGSIAGLVILAVKTDLAAGRDGISLLLVDPRAAGFERGRKLDKLGLHAQDLAELSFTDMRIPIENLLGRENEGFGYLTANLAAERLSIAVNSQAAASSVLEWTVKEVAGAKVTQKAKFVIAECATDIAAGQALVDQAIVDLVHNRLEPSAAAAAKLYCTELQGRVVSACWSLHPAEITGRGDSLITRALLDARVSRIYGGSSEIMKVIVSHGLGL
ncbi:acyl-CoA dehydrogenase family protein [Gordonia rubripertincta]|uniref:Acyl-CoA dehydrogenase family protein n=1 Tax=Gordonia rubripertincta TaxID=36822 RepID=A0ABT4MVM2_GORRU|nr:acyl-CoA dehydrogenase family protein [Gordonia rubripertincta]MCZ4551058.1 acyl-CoA dehydrogenase family protein [Gordonia rubripertincta]